MSDDTEPRPMPDEFKCLQIDPETVTRESLIAQGVTPSGADELLAFGERLRAKNRARRGEPTWTAHPLVMRLDGLLETAGSSDTLPVRCSLLRELREALAPSTPPTPGHP